MKNVFVNFYVSFHKSEVYVTGLLHERSLVNSSINKCTYNFEIFIL